MPHYTPDSIAAGIIDHRIPVKCGTNAWTSALVDGQDHGHLKQFKWFLSSGRYAQRYQREGFRKYVKVMMHREVMGAGRGEQIDHINRDMLDNRRVNLRFSTQSQNLMNRRKRRRPSTSRHKGVSFIAARRHLPTPWIAQIVVDGHYQYLGYFQTEEAAACAYNYAAQRLFGKFAYLNEVD